MNVDRPNPDHVQGSSSSTPAPQIRALVEDFDDDDEEDARHDNGLLADDPLGGSLGKAP